MHIDPDPTPAEGIPRPQQLSLFDEPFCECDESAQTVTDGADDCGTCRGKTAQ